MPPPDALIERLERRDYTVGVIGLGYVGLPLVLAFGDAGFRVLGFDTDAAKVRQLNAGASYIQRIDGERIARLVGQGRLEATAAPERLGEPAALIICVPTPLTPQREPDLQYVEHTADAIARTLRPGQLVSLESTSYPGTTEDILLPRFAATGLKLGVDYFVAYSPEREDPGNRQHSVGTIPKVVGGVTDSCLALASRLYATVVERVVPVSSTRVAEATKLVENIYRAVNIALVNELKVAFTGMGIDVWEVLEAAKTKPFGFQAFAPGPGLGGHCIPIDPFYLTWKAREYEIVTRFIELAGEINAAMPGYVVQRLADALNDRGLPLRGAKVLILGVAYKKDVDDPRESPALKIIDSLLRKGAVADYSDPFFDRLPPTRHLTLVRGESVALTPASLRAYDAVMLVTDHSSFPYRTIAESARLIVDTRNAFRQRGLTGSHIVLA